MIVTVCWLLVIASAAKAISTNTNNGTNSSMLVVGDCSTAEAIGTNTNNGTKIQG